MKGQARFVGAFLVVAAVTLQPNSASGADGVPLQLQAQLVSKLASFDRNFAARAGATANVLVVQKAGHAESAQIAANVAKALASMRDVGGAPAHVEVMTFTSASALAQRCRSERVSLIYFSSGLEADMPGTGKELSGVDVLTIGATASLATRGVVVAFDLEEGKPKLVISLARAKSQNVSFKAELLRLARIVE